MKTCRAPYSIFIHNKNTWTKTKPNSFHSTLFNSVWLQHWQGKDSGTAGKDVGFLWGYIFWVEDKNRLGGVSWISDRGLFHVEADQMQNINMWHLWDTVFANTVRIKNMKPNEIIREKRIYTKKKTICSGYNSTVSPFYQTSSSENHLTLKWCTATINQKTCCLTIKKVSRPL